LARRRAARLACLIAAISVCPGLARAQGAPAAEEAPSDAYKQHMSNGVKLFNDRNYAAAIVEFEAAYAERPRASPLLNIALCHKSLFNYPRAITTLELALSRHGSAMDPTDREAAQHAIDEMRALLGYVTVELDPPHATLLLDGDPLPSDATDKPLPLGPGRHRLSARAEGYAPTEQTITVISGEKDKRVRLALVPDKGWVVVKTDDPEMAIAIDQQPLAMGEWAGFVEPGTHLVQMYKPDGPDYARQVLVVAGKAQEVRPDRDSVPIALPRTAPPAPPAPPKAKPPDPPLRGAYAQVGGGAFLMLKEKNWGFLVGGRFGYRLSTPVGLEVMFDYANIDIRARNNAASSVELNSARFGGNLRLMSPGRKVRFVSTIGGGFAYNWLSGGKSPGGTAFINLDTGLELDFRGVLVGLQAHQTLLFGGSETADIDLQSPRVLFGLSARVGFGAW
jgi:hypothetical protein